MRRSDVALPAPMDTGRGTVARSDWGTLRKLLPYLWRYRWRVGLALAFLVAAKVANVGVPVLLKYLVDGLSIKPGDASALLVVPVGLLLAYAGLRLSTSLFTELRELIFAKATEGTARSISLQVFRHLHALSLRFHLERQTGGMTRDIERGTRAVHSLISYSLYSIVPTIIEVAMVLTLAGGEVRRPVRLDHRGRAGGLHQLHRHRDRVAHQVPPPDERARRHGAHARHRFAAELRDRQVLQQRGLRGEALRREPGAAAPRGAEEPEHAVAAQHRAATGHRQRAGGDAVARHAGRGRRPADAGRPGDDQRLHDPAVHPAQLPGRAVPRDQAEPDRPGQDVRAARARPRGRRPARRAAAAREPGRGALRARVLRLRAGRGRSCTT